MRLVLRALQKAVEEVEEGLRVLLGILITRQRPRPTGSSQRAASRTDGIPALQRKPRIAERMLCQLALVLLLLSRCLFLALVCVPRELLQQKIANDLRTSARVSTRITARAVCRVASLGKGSHAARLRKRTCSL